MHWSTVLAGNALNAICSTKNNLLMIIVHAKAARYRHKYIIKYMDDILVLQLRVFFCF